MRDPPERSAAPAETTRKSKHKTLFAVKGRREHQKVQFETQKNNEACIAGYAEQRALFLFTVVDGIFVGRVVGTNGLGAVNLALPFISGPESGSTLLAASLQRG